MEYNLPHAVLALLQEENSPHAPKSYFISSSTRSTKITLIYTRRKRESTKKTKTRSCSDVYLSSGTDDYSQNMDDKFRGVRHTGSHRRICSSTPGRGYNDAARVRERSGSINKVKMATDPLRRSSSKDHLSIHHFKSEIKEHHASDSDFSNHYEALSPCSIDRPPTPGRNLLTSASPPPPTPNVNNYASAISDTNIDLLYPRSMLCSQPTIEYDDTDVSPPPTPCFRKTNDPDPDNYRLNVSQSRLGSSKYPIEQTNKSTKIAPPPSSMRLQTSKYNDIGSHYNKPGYHRNQSWDGSKRY